MKTTSVVVIALLACALIAIVGCNKGVESTPVNARIYDFSVVTGSGNAVSGAAIRIQTNSATYGGSTDGSGNCRVSIPNEVSLPTYVVATIDHSQILPEARTFPGAANETASRKIQCSALPGRVYVRDASLRHLGNDLYGGPENSQLQIPSQGTTQSYSFHLDQAPGQMPYLRIFARGIQHPTRIKINGTTTNQLGNSASNGDLSSYTFRLGGSTSVFRSGTNTLTVETSPTGLNNDPLDDIEFCSLALYYQ